MKSEKVDSPTKRAYVRGWRVKGALRPLPFDGRARFKRQTIPELVAAGCSCHEMARLCRTNLSNIYYAIRQGRLRDQLRAAQIVRFTNEARPRWLNAIALNPLTSQNQLIKVEPRAYKWLWRHDRAWLDAHRPTQVTRKHRARSDKSPPRGQGAAIAAAIRRAARAIKAEVPCQRCTRNSLRRTLGMTAHAFKRVQADGHVSKALALVVETFEQFHERRQLMLLQIAKG